MNRRPLVLAVVGVLAAAAPALATPSSNGRYLNTDSLNGRYLNGRYLNGRYLNGTLLAGRDVNGRHLYGPFLDGVEVKDTYLAGSQIVGTRNGVFVDNLEGALLTSTVVDNLGRDAGTETLRIDKQLPGEGKNADVTYYQVSVLEGGWVQKDDPDYGPYWGWDQWWSPLCPDDNLAIAVPGTWDYRVGVAGAGGRSATDGMTLACSTGAIGKCVDQLGYKPWVWRSRDATGWYWDWSSWQWQYGPHLEWYSLADLHQACVRLVRADYCGNGVSHTDDGTEIDVGDNLSPLINLLGSGRWGFEASWDAGGAMCLAAARYQDYVTQTGCACEDSWFDADGGQHMYCMEETVLPFAVGGCELPADSLFNRSKTVPVEDTGPY
jgi:hypothetical protein